MVTPIFSEAAVPVLGPPLRPPTGFLALEILKQVEIQGLFVVPNVIEQIAQEPEGIKLLQTLNFIYYAGGPLSEPVGDRLSSVVDLCQFYGMTETISPPQLVPKPGDWAYMEWHPDSPGVMEPSDDGAFELVYLSERLSEHSSALKHNLPDVKEFRTKDLFKPHPTKSNLWRFHGRTDDIIVLSNGEKFNPVAMETTLQGHALISGALVVGQGLSEALLLIAPKSKDDIGLEFVEKI